MEVHQKLFARRNPVQKVAGVDPGTLPKAEISVAAIKSLRDKTGFPIGDCKNALVQANGDEEKAIGILQLNTPQTRMIVEMIQQMYPNVTFDVVCESGEILLVNTKTQNVIAGSINGQINLYPNAQ